MKAEEYLAENGIPNFKWSKPIDFQDEVKEDMDFPNSFAEIMEAYHQSRVNAISDEEIDKLVNDWIDGYKNITSRQKRNISFGFQEGLYKCKNKLLKK